MQRDLLAATAASGAALEAYPFSALHHKRFEIAMLVWPDSQEVLKAAIQIYFYHQPVQIEQLNLDFRLGMFSNIIVLIETVNKGLAKLEGFGGASEVGTFDSFLTHLRAKLAHDTAKLYGSDSEVSKYEQEYFLANVKDRMRCMAAEGIKWSYVSLRDSGEARVDSRSR
jgi:hypothetical protein